MHPIIYHHAPLSVQESKTIERAILSSALTPELWVKHTLLSEHNSTVSVEYFLAALHEIKLSMAYWHQHHDNVSLILSCHDLYRKLNTLLNEIHEFYQCQR